MDHEEAHALHILVCNVTLEELVAITKRRMFMIEKQNGNHGIA
jgi:hypothetical protein